MKSSSRSTFGKRLIRFQSGDFVTVVSVLMAAIAVVAVVYFIVFPSRGFFHSDCTDTIYWAQASYEAKAVFQQDFQYATLMPFGGHLLMLPFIGLFGVSMTTQTLGMLLFFAVFLASLVFLLRTLGWDLKWSAFTIAMLLLTLSASVKMREIFWQHIIYYSLGVLFLQVGLAMVLRALRISENQAAADQRLPATRQLVLIFVWFAFCATNMMQGLTIFAIPMLAGVAGEIFLRFDTPLNDTRNRPSKQVLIAMLSGTIFGLALGIILMGSLEAPYANGFASFSDPSAWMDNLNQYLPHWMSLLGVTVVKDDVFASVDGIVNLIRLVFGLVMMIVPAVMALLYRKIADRSVRILILIHWTLTALILFAYVFGVLSSANWRLSPIVATSTLLCVAFCRWIFDQTRGRRLLPFILVPMILAAMTVSLQIAAMPANLNQSKGLNAVADYLVSQNLTYGYATFWQANAVTVLSDSAVKVRNVELTGEGVEPYLYQSRSAWYDDQDGQKRYFLLVTEEEYIFMNDSQHGLLSAASDIREYAEYRILIFERNIF